MANTGNRIPLSLLSTDRTALMGLSILFIMLYHCFIFYFGHFGVDFFLILSAVGLTYSDHRHHRKYSAFIAHRLRRVLPAYLLVAVPLLLVRDKSTALGNLLFFNMLRGKDMTYWFIFYVILFYLLFPFLRRLMQKRGLFTAILLLSFPVCYLLSLKFGQYDFLLCRVPVILLSMLIGEAVAQKKSVSAPLTYSLSILGLIIWGIAFFFIKTRTFAGGPSLVYLIASVFCLPILLLLDRTLVRVPLFSRVFTALGKVTLELYMVHETVVRPLTKKMLLTFIDNPIILQVALIPLSLVLAWLLSLALHYVIGKITVMIERNA